MVPTQREKRISDVYLIIEMTKYSIHTFLTTQICVFWSDVTIVRMALQFKNLNSGFTFTYIAKPSASINN